MNLFYPQRGLIFGPLFCSTCTVGSQALLSICLSVCISRFEVGSVPIFACFSTVEVGVLTTFQLNLSVLIGNLKYNKKTVGTEDFLTRWR